jgi:hypothetical protein
MVNVLWLCKSFDLKFGCFDVGLTGATQLQTILRGKMAYYSFVFLRYETGTNTIQNERNHLVHDMVSNF